MQLVYNMRWVAGSRPTNPAWALRYQQVHKVSIQDAYAAVARPARILQMEISDDHGVRQWVDVPEIMEVLLDESTSV